MSGASGITVGAQDLYTEETNPVHKLGQVAQDEYGNTFRYAQAGGTALVTGHLLQEAAEDTNYTSMVNQATSAIGATTISVTLGGTAVTASQFDQGILTIEQSTGLGQTFRILSHTVQTSTTGTCVFTIDRPLKIATVVTNTQVTVRKNPYDGVIDNPTTQTGNVVGVALYAMTASAHGWIQTGGDTGVLFDTGTNTSDGVLGIGPSAAVAGSVKPQGGGEGATIIGFARIVASTDSTFGIAHLTID